MGFNITDGFDSGDDEKVISVLKKFKGGPISDRLFTVLAGMLPMAGVVVVIIFNKKNPEVIFVPRPTDDILWRGKLNLPGKMFRVLDYSRNDKNPLYGPLERIEKDEIETKLPKTPIFAGVSLSSDKRGPMVILVYYIELKSKLEYKGVGEWVKVEDVVRRDDTVRTEINHIKIALKKF